nr:hypothetical protein [Niabella hibiscisoli]
MLVLLIVSAKAQTSSRPNILIIMTDQQTADAMSIAGNKGLHTPAMDKLAKTGFASLKPIVPSLYARHPGQQFLVEKCLSKRALWVMCRREMACGRTAC